MPTPSRRSSFSAGDCNGGPDCGCQPPMTSSVPDIGYAPTTGPARRVGRVGRRPGRARRSARRGLGPDQFLERVLKDLRGFALEQQALVAADLAPQVDELVAQSGGFLELQVRGRLAHLAPDLLRHRLGDLARKVSCAHGIRRVGTARGAAEDAQDVVDFLADRFRLYAVLEVESDLHFAAAFGLAA